MGLDTILGLLSRTPSDLAVGGVEKTDPFERTSDFGRGL